MAKCLVSLVTGGASGLGKATVQKLIKRGGKVVMCDIQESKGIELQNEYGENMVFSRGDVCSESDMNSAMQVAKDKFGRLDVVVNCAGVASTYLTCNFNKKLAHNLEDFQRIVMVNTVGTFNVVRLAAGLIGENEPNEDGQRGVIINTSCMSAFDGQKGQAAYAASKAAVAGMTLPLARDLSSQGIRVMAIAPGLFDSPILSYLPNKVRLFMEKMVLSPQRLGNPTEFAHMVVSIIDNPFLNAEVIRLDGGLRLVL